MAKKPKEGDQCTMPNGDMGEMQMDENGDMVCMPMKPKKGITMNKETIELDADAVTAISEKVADALNLDEKIDQAVAKAADAVVAKMEGINKKNISDEEDKEDADEGAKDDEDKDPIAEEPKELRLFHATRALAAGDLATVKRYRDYAKSLRTKTGYANTDDNEDGGYLVPDPEFDTTVYENLPKYGVAFKFADVRQTDRTAVKVLSLDSGLTFYATNEGVAKTSAKLQFNRKTVDLQKYAVIVPSTDELADDSAIDYWALVTKELARALAKKADEITFTDTTYGITNTTGVITEPVSGAGTTIDWGDLLNAESAVEDDLDTSGFQWFMRKETWFRLIALKGSTNDHYLTGSLSNGWVPNPNNPSTPWGTPVVFTRVLPKSTTVGDNDAFAIYGDLSNYILYQKRGMALKMLTEATITDTESSNFNLATQDGTAMRAVVRLLGVLPHGNAPKFVILGTGTVS